MRLVAGCTGNALGMVGRDDLGEPFRPGAVRFVAARAQYSWIRKNGLDARIFGVPGERSVTGLAVYVGMLAGFLLLENVHVARFAGLVSGVRDGKTGHVGEGVSAIMAVFSEAPGDEIRADCEECKDSQQEDACDTQEVLGISESIHSRIRRMHAGHQTVEGIQNIAFRPGERTERWARTVPIHRNLRDLTQNSAFARWRVLAGIHRN